MKLTTTLALAAICSCAPFAPISAPANEGLSARARSLWLSLPGSRSHCRDFDYFPDGGIRSFACHTAPPAMYAELVREAGVSPFLSGPHSDQSLNLSSPNSFGRYNPRFVRLLIDTALPAAGDDAFRAATQNIWDEQVRPLAHVMLATYRKFEENPQLLRRERARYEGLLASGRLPAGDYERYFSFMNPRFEARIDANPDYFFDEGFDGGYEGNVVKTCAAFWIRRNIDGTDKIFYEGLIRAFRTYEPEMLEER